MSFASPYLLAALVLPVLALVGYVWFERRPPRSAISFPNLAVLASVATRSSWRRHVIAGLLLGAVALLCVAVAAPAGADRHDVRPRHGGARGRRVVLDGGDGRRTRAGSRQRGPRSRRSPNHVPSRVKVGLVAFADDPVVVTSPTTNRGLLKAASRHSPRDTGRRSATRSAAASISRACRPGRARRPRRPRTREVDRRDRPPLGRHPDARRADAGRRRPARQGSRHPGLHDRARHADRNGHDRPERQRGRRPGASRPDDAGAHRRVDGRLARSTSPTPRSSARSTTGSARSSPRHRKPREVTAAFVAVAAALLTRRDRHRRALGTAASLEHPATRSSSSLPPQWRPCCRSGRSRCASGASLPSTASHSTSRPGRSRA